MSTLKDTIRRAKSRLTDMVINEVSLVDKAANLRTFAVIKRDDMPTQKMTLKLPAAAKQALMDGLGQVIDKVTALASVVGDAEVDDAAAVPTELGTALTQTAQMLTGMSQQYSGDAPPADDGSAPPPQSDAASAPPENKSAEGAPATKALPPEQHDGDSLKTLMRDGDSLKTVLHKAIILAHAAIVEKAGRKIAGHRYKQLEDLHGTLGKLLNDLSFDEATEANDVLNGAADDAAAAATKAKKPPPPPAKDDTKEPAAAKKSEEELTKKNAAASSDAPPWAKELKGLITTTNERLEKAETKLEAVAKGHPVSNGGPVDGPVTKNAKDGEDAVQWAADMSAAVAKRKSNGTANGARK